MKRTDITALFPQIEIPKEALDKIMELNGADINAAKADTETLRTQLAAAQAEIEQLKAKPSGDAAKVAELESELNGLKAANALRDLRDRISKETGVPADLLTAETEDACKSQAAAINAYARPSSYPNVPDGGEAHPDQSATAREKFKSWAKDAL